MDVDEIVSLYNNVLQELLDKHAPVQTRTIAERLVQPWMNNNITKAKRDRRKAEILYERTKVWNTDNSTRGVVK